MSSSSADAGLSAKREAFAQHQRQAVKPSSAERARTILALAKTGTLSTLAGKGEEAGFPRGSVVEYATDKSGRLIFSFSSLSAHTSDVRHDGRCSLTVLQPGFQDMSNARLTVSGNMRVVPEEETASLKEAYRQRHPNSFWIDFGDFTLFQLDLVVVRFNFGFASAGKVSAAEFLQTQPDPVAPFSAPIAGHMNDDHALQMLDITRHYVPLDTDITGARMLALDRLGMEVECSSAEGAFSCRVPFVRPAEDRKAVKDVIVEMSKASSQAKRSQQQH